jgi:hypothetical protein
LKKSNFYFLVLLIIIAFSSCNENDKSTITFYQSTAGSMPSSWEYECFPEGHISLIRADETLSSKLFSFVGGGTNYYKFKAEKPGEFILCWVRYDNLYWISEDNSYVVDYVINENLEIEQVGEQRSIYEIEKYDKLLFEQYVDQIERNFDRSFEAEKLVGIKYLITSDYQTKTIYLNIKNNNYDEREIIQFTEKEMDFYLNNFGTVSVQYKYSITIE